MLAKAVANETDATFIKMAGSELVRKFIGEGARLVRDLFELAAEREPAVIFIDEIDAIASKRTDSKTSGDAEVQRTMMQLLSEMDGFDERGEIRIMAATNRFDMLDGLSSARAGSTASSKFRTPMSKAASASSKSTRRR